MVSRNLGDRRPFNYYGIRPGLKTLLTVFAFPLVNASLQASLIKTIFCMLTLFYSSRICLLYYSYPTIMMILSYAMMLGVAFLFMNMLTKRMSGDGMMGGMGKSKAKVYMEKQTEQLSTSSLWDLRSLTRN